MSGGKAKAPTAMLCNVLAWSLSDLVDAPTEEEVSYLFRKNCDYYYCFCHTGPYFAIE